MGILSYLLLCLLASLCLAHVHTVVDPGQYLEIGGIVCKGNDSCIYDIQVSDSNGNFQLVLNRCGSNDPRDGGVLALGTYFHGTNWIHQEYDVCIQIYNMNLLASLDVKYRIEDLTPALQRQMNVVAVSYSIITFLLMTSVCCCSQMISLLIFISMYRRKKSSIVYMKSDDTEELRESI